MDDLKFISLGPTCQTAGILQNCDLRRYSYPFDWCQSGYVHHRDIMHLSDEIFYFRHIHSPAVHYEYVSNSKKDINGHTTGQLELPDIPYGYRSFYNPHRESGKEKAYFLRCLERFRRDSLNSKCRKFYMLSDYTNKHGSVYLNDEARISLLLENELNGFAKGEWRLLLYRINLIDNSRLTSYSVRQLSAKTILIVENLPVVLDDFYYKDIDSSPYVKSAILLNKRRAIRDAENFCLC